MIALDIFQTGVVTQIYKVAKVVHGGRSNKPPVRYVAVHTAIRAVLANTMLPSSPNTHTRTHAHAHARTHLSLIHI